MIANNPLNVKIFIWRYCALRFLGLAGGMTSVADEVEAPAMFDSDPYTAPAPIVPLNPMSWNW